MKGVIDTDPYALPKGLPVPVDDGACRHLRGMKMPSFSLPSAAAHDVNLETVSIRNAVFFFYPETGKPGALIPDGWNDIPGARGCTPQSWRVPRPLSRVQEIRPRSIWCEHSESG